MTMNLLNETVEILERNGKTFKDVVAIYDKDVVCCWNVFAAAAARFIYDNGFGCAEVNEDLIIAGDNWWLERREYDGSEWWEFKTLPPLNTQKTTYELDLRSNFERSWDKN